MRVERKKCSPFSPSNVMPRDSWRADLDRVECGERMVFGTPAGFACVGGEEPGEVRGSVMEAWRRRTRGMKSGKSSACCLGCRAGTALRWSSPSASHLPCAGLRPPSEEAELAEICDEDLVIVL